MTDAKEGETASVGVLEMAATGVTAALHKTAVAPIERVRLLVQSHGELVRHGRALRLPRPEDLAADETAVGRLRSRFVARTGLGFAFDGVTTTYARHVMATEGWVGLFRGNSLSVASALCTGPAQVLAVAPLHRWVVNWVFMRPDPTQNQFLFVVAHAAAAVVSGIVASVLLYPLEVLRLAMAVDVKIKPIGTGAVTAGFEHTSLRALMADVGRGTFANTAGARAQDLGMMGAAPFACLYRGLWLGIVGQVAYRSSLFGIYELVGTLRGEKKFSPAQEFAASYAMTGACTLLLYPLDTVRRRYMRAGVSVRAAQIDAEMATRGVTDAAGAALNVNPDTGARIAYRNWTECATHIYREEGPHAFFRGASLLPIRSLVVTAAMFTIPRFLGSHTLQ
uniref:ADP,ATP carrier protein n=1 Tax=Neobodo designis TaxID=312471 RepID=A0A7S1QDX8_NEODS